MSLIELQRELKILKKKNYKRKIKTRKKTQKRN